MIGKPRTQRATWLYRWLDLRAYRESTDRNSADGFDLEGRSVALSKVMDPVP